MNTPWVIAALVAIVFFAFVEFLAFRHPDRLNTLSRTVSTIGATWPMSIWLMGLGTGILAAHFFWAWPTNPLAGGG